MTDSAPLEIEIYDGHAQLAEELDYLHTLHAKYFGPSKPFYWTKPAETGCASSGWYQWTDKGLIYLGETILEKIR